MFTHKINENVARVYNVNTRGADRYHFYLERKHTVKYGNSPYYKGSELWDMLHPDTIECDSFSCLNAVLKMKLIHTMYHNKIIYTHILDIDIECYIGIECIILLFLLFLCILSPEDQGQP